MAEGTNGAAGAEATNSPLLSQPLTQPCKGSRTPNTFRAGHEVNEEFDNRSIHVEKA